MTKLVVYDGNRKPAIAIGKNQVNTLTFAEKYRGWHYAAKDRATKNAINGLKKRGLIETNEHGQFRYKNSRN